MTPAPQTSAPSLNPSANVNTWGDPTVPVRNDGGEPPLNATELTTHGASSTVKTTGGAVPMTSPPGAHVAVTDAVPGATPVS